MVTPKKERRRRPASMKDLTTPAAGSATQAAAHHHQASLIHLRPGRKGVAHNSCCMQAHHVSRHFPSNLSVKEKNPLALHLRHVLLDHFQNILSCDPSMFIETRAPTS